MEEDEQQIEVVNHRVYVSAAGKTVYGMLIKVIGAVLCETYKRMQSRDSWKKRKAELEYLADAAGDAINYEYETDSNRFHAIKAAAVEEKCNELLREVKAVLDGFDVKLYITIVTDVKLTRLQVLHIKRIMKDYIEIFFENPYHVSRRA